MAQGSSEWIPPLSVAEISKDLCMSCCCWVGNRIVGNKTVVKRWVLSNLKRASRSWANPTIKGLSRNVSEYRNPTNPLHQSQRDYHVWTVQLY